MYTIDTSVWISATEPSDSNHAVCRQLIVALRRHRQQIIVPTLVRVEIAGAISRLRTQARAIRVLAIFDHLPRVSLTNLDASLAQVAVDLASAHRLRGADAVYAAVTLRNSTTLISRDREHLTRLVGVIPVLSPEDALAELSRVP